jgi:hypothetical protein
MSIVASLILALLPVVLQWLAALLQKHSAALDATGDQAADSHRLLTSALGDPSLRGRPFRRAVVRLLLHRAPDVIRAGAKLDDNDLADLKAYGVRGGSNAHAKPVPAGS